MTSKLGNMLEFETNCLLTVAFNGELRRLTCPFKVRLIADVPHLDFGFIYPVQAVMLSKDGLMVYYVLGKAYYYYHFLLLIDT
ncbi:MAG: hypothetical protein ACSHXL_03445 [Bacteroidota bacterium]